MPATENPTRAALEAAVLDLTDEQIASALCKVDRAVKAAYEERSAYAWPREAQLSLLGALATRLQRGRVPASEILINTAAVADNIRDIEKALNIPDLIKDGYPLGPHAIVVALNKGPGIGLVQGFSGPPSVSQPPL